MYLNTRCVYSFYLFEGTSEGEFKLLSFIWMFKVTATSATVGSRADPRRRAGQMRSGTRGPIPTTQPTPPVAGPAGVEIINTSKFKLYL
jgi:hypothetical protein